MRSPSARDCCEIVITSAVRHAKCRTTGLANLRRV
jgi:hypothetical protein